jgi:ribonucleoside-diphosphate reductase alpha chain
MSDLTEAQAAELALKLQEYCELKGIAFSDSLGTLKLVRKESKLEDTEKFIINRKGKKEALDPAKVYERNRKLALEHKAGELRNIDLQKISDEVCSKIYNGMTTAEIDELTQNIAYSMGFIHYEYDSFAVRVAIDNDHKKNRSYTFYGFMKMLYENKNHKGDHAPIITNEGFKFIEKHANELNRMVEYDRDFDMFDYFAYTEIKSKLPKCYDHVTKTKTIVGGPQDMFLRVAIALHYIHESNVGSTEVMKRIKTCYDIFSRGYYTHATPGLIGALTPKGAWISCFLLSMSDSLNADDGKYQSSIGQTLIDTMMISKARGGVAITGDMIRCKNSYISGTNCLSQGAVPFMLIFDRIVPAVNQSGSRRGAIAMYMQIQHADIIEFMEATDNHGVRDKTGLNLFYGIVLNDMFFEREKTNGMYSFFDPSKYPELFTTHGDEFNKLYLQLESEGKYEYQKPVSQVRNLLLKCIISHGKCYLLQRDHINKTSNQSKNLGTVTMSNLCTEITTYTNDKQHGTCTLASIGLPAFVEYFENDNEFQSNQNLIMTDIKSGMNVFDLAAKWLKFDTKTRKNMPNVKYRVNYAKLCIIAGVSVYNLETVIDINHYPSKQTEFSSRTNRPIGIGIQGLDDVYKLLWLPFASSGARIVNSSIMEHIYFGCVWFSCAIAKNVGPYASYRGSWVDCGYLKPELFKDVALNPNLPWDTLKSNVKTYGIRHSYLTALMPTASTSQMLGNSECFAPPEELFFKRSSHLGTFNIVSRFMQEILTNLGVWDKNLYQHIVEHNSIADTNLSNDIKELFKTAYEIKNRELIDQAVARMPFVCQSQSLNMFVDLNDVRIITGQISVTDILWSAVKYANEKELPTLLYYLRQKPIKNTNQSKELVESIAQARKNRKTYLENEIKSETITKSERYKMQREIEWLKIKGEDITQDYVPESEVVVESEGPVCSRDNPNCESCSG